MPMSNLFSVSDINTWVNVKNNSSNNTSIYAGRFIDIPVSLLETCIKSVSAIARNHLLIIIA